MDYIVKTPCGLLQGAAGRLPGTAAYKGIRYATAGRWEYPTQVTSWEGTYDATQYGSCSYQPRAFYDEELNEKKYFYYNEFRKDASYTYSEDCLFLNVFTPDTAREGDKLPVLIYIHGGGYTGGCGHEKHFDGPVWPAKGVIGVTLNYRLGLMGFVCLPQLEEEAGHTGNYGLYDQMTAIKWVKDNIASFGGDPDNITIMGQSAGGASVQLQCQSPLTDGLFQRAVMSSGCGMGGMLMGKKRLQHGLLAGSNEPLRLQVPGRIPGSACREALRGLEPVQERYQGRWHCRVPCYRRAFCGRRQPAQGYPLYGRFHQP